MTRHFVRSALLLLFVPAALVAQVIPLKSVPIPSGEQFLLFPSSNFGMAGVSVAFDDEQGDPFWNPARGALLEGARIHVVPTLYGETNDALGGRTLPIALTIGANRQFGTVMIGLQQLDEFRGRTFVPFEDAESNFGGSTLNTYVQGGLGFTMPDGVTSLGVSGMYADLDAIDGVSQLYFRAARLEQDGRLAEIRLGALRDLGAGRRLDAVALLRDLDMTHRQTIAVWQLTDSVNWTGEWTQWQETGHDRTTTRGGLLRYSGPMSAAGSRFGLQLAGSWKSHPKIPEYDLNFPRDPGTSRAFSVGAGLTEQRGRALFSLEALFEPAWSHTWALADSALTTPTGVIESGEKTVDNRFRFSNWSLAGGFGYDREGIDLQLGLRVRAIQYDLEQQNFVAEGVRETEEGWLEWSPSWGFLWNLEDIQLRYTGRWISKGNPGAGCGLPIIGGCDDAVSAPDGGDIDYLVAPEGAVSMPDYRVTTHRFSISVPLGRAPRAAAASAEPAEGTEP